MKIVEKTLAQVELCLDRIEEEKRRLRDETARLRDETDFFLETVRDAPLTSDAYRQARLARRLRRLDRLGAVDVDAVRSEARRLFARQASVSDLIRLLVRHQVGTAVSKQEAILHDVLVHPLDPGACACPPRDRRQFWVKSDQSLFCGRCGRLQAPSFLTVSVDGMSGPEQLAPEASGPLSPLRVAPGPEHEKLFAKQVKWRQEFVEMLELFQGKRAKNMKSVPRRLLDDLLAFFHRSGLLVKDNHQFTRLSLLHPGHVRRGLEVIGCTKHLEAAPFVFSKITGKLAHNLAHLESALLKDFLAVVDVYLELRVAGELTVGTFLHPHFLLVKLLLRRGETVEPWELVFSSLRTEGKRQQQSVLAATLFQRLDADKKAVADTGTDS